MCNTRRNYGKMGCKAYKGVKMTLFDYMALYPLEFLKYLSIGLAGIVLICWVLKILIGLLKK